MLYGWILFPPLALLGALAEAEVTPPLEQLLPPEIHGWQATGDDQVFDRDTLFDYMNGAGELYLAYDFQRLLVRRYTQPEAPPLVAELYQMDSAVDAYGVFSTDTVGEKISVGQDGIYASGLLKFWKDRVFGRILAVPATGETRAAVLAVGQTVAQAIPHEGKLPLLLHLLPTEDRLPDSVHFFHQQRVLNFHYFLAENNLLRLSAQTHVVMAQYRRGEPILRLLAVQYPTPTEAEKAAAQFLKLYLHEEKGLNPDTYLTRIERGEWVGLRRAKQFLLLVFEAHDEAACRELLQAAEKRLRDALRRRLL